MNEDEDYVRESWQKISDMLAIGIWAVSLLIILLSVFYCLLLGGKLV